MYHQLPFSTLSALVKRHSPCVVLDTARPSSEQRRSFVFVNPRETLVCDDFEKLPGFLAAFDTLSKTSWLAGYLTYEASYALETRFSGFTEKRAQKHLAWFGVFDEPFIFDHRSGKWNREPAVALAAKEICDDRAGMVNCHVPTRNKTGRHNKNSSLHHTCTYNKYSRLIQKIRRYIAAGDVYQINFTYDVSVSGALPAWEQYLEHREHQPVPFGAFMQTGSETIASFSPELFFMKQGRRIVTRPMKGTARRGRFSREDDERAAALAADPKNRSENVMIVDLLRNDLGKICETGSIGTSRLFDVERHPTVLQMTSTVEGVLNKGTSLSSIFRALFPCGSVTGAPKIRAMEIIHALESGARGAYCGAIGYSSPRGKACFSVPIRTMQHKKAATLWRYRVGSGIVWDSRAKEEWQECRDKCLFLIDKKPEFSLVESLLYDKNGFLYCGDHKKRLFDAAGYFGFDASEKEWDRTIETIETALVKKRSVQYKIRILLDKTGCFSSLSEPIAMLPHGVTHPALVASGPIDTQTPFLFHKTTYRPWYRKAMNAIRAGRCFDVLHCNREGQLTEGARSNIFLKINNQLYTPPIECGLLPGVLRGRLLRQGKCIERVLYKKDLGKAERVYCGNSVRGLVEVTIKDIRT